MKNLILLLTILFYSLQIPAQTADTSMRKTADAVCSCLEKSNIQKSATEEEMQQIFMKCMLDSAGPAITEIFMSGETNPQAAAEEFGQKMAIELVNSGCKPFMQMSLKLAGGNVNSAPNIQAKAVNSTEGEVIKVEEKDFLYITVKNSAGRELQFIYLSYVPNSDSWIKDPEKNLLNKKVTIKWTETEVYQPRLKEFVNIKTLTELVVK